MKRFQLTENFYLDELVDVKTYHEYAQKNQLYKMAYKVDRDLLNALQAAREYMNESCTINNWWSVYKAFNGNLHKTLQTVKIRKLRQWGGWRPAGTPYYRPDSMHSEFKAADLLFKSKGWLKKFRTYIYMNWQHLNITGLEVEISWGHIDTRYKPNQKELMVFTPKKVLPNWTPY